MNTHVYVPCKHVGYRLMRYHKGCPVPKSDVPLGFRCAFNMEYWFIEQLRDVHSVLMKSKPKHETLFNRMNRYKKWVDPVVLPVMRVVLRLINCIRKEPCASDAPSRPKSDLRFLAYKYSDGRKVTVLVKGDSLNEIASESTT